MRPAATVLLARECGDGIEVLLMRRGEGLSFMGGLWVFPGGRMETVDRSPEALARIRDDDRRACDEHLRDPEGEQIPSDEALGLRVAACRETFEEAGVLLARDARGTPCDPELVARLQPRRADVVQEPGTFMHMLADEGLYLDAAPLVYWSHWITPSVEPKRFDTRFYVVALPPDQEASADLSELTEHAWVNPAEVGSAFERGEIRMAPPTLLTLDDLAESYARHGGLEAMLAAERDRDIPPIMPKIVPGEDEFRVIMPWDPEYGALTGEGSRIPDSFPGHLARRRSRLTFPRDVRR